MPSALDKYDDSWDVIEHPFAFEDSFFAGGEFVDAPVLHQVFRVYRYLADILLENRHCLQVGAEVTPAIASLAAIDYASGFFAGKRTTRADYIAFMRQFFPSAYQPYLDAIYRDLRCGLLHNLVAVNPWDPTGRRFLITRSSPAHLEVQDDRIVWSVQNVLEHTLRAWAMYMHHLIMDAPDNADAIEKFRRRFVRLGGAAAFMVHETP